MKSETAIYGGQGGIGELRKNDCPLCKESIPLCQTGFSEENRFVKEGRVFSVFCQIRESQPPRLVGVLKRKDREKTPLRF